MHRIKYFMLLSATLAASRIVAQSPSPVAQPPTPVVLPSPNAITTVANGVSITFVPGSSPIFTANSASTDPATPGLTIAMSKTIRYIDKHGNSIDPATIKPTESLQPIFDSDPNGRVLSTVMVDRN